MIVVTLVAAAAMLTLIRCLWSYSFCNVYFVSDDCSDSVDLFLLRFFIPWVNCVSS